MVIGPNIAKNGALRENVFMMAVCIQLRIPLFLIGKPGSSKSLAKSIIQNSMHGTASTTNLLRSLKQVLLSLIKCINRLPVTILVFAMFCHLLHLAVLYHKKKESSNDCYHSQSCTCNCALIWFCIDNNIFIW